MSDKVVRILDRDVTRRDIIKAGGIAGVGLAFSKPLMSNLKPSKAFGGYEPTSVCPGTVDFNCTSQFLSSLVPINDFNTNTPNGQEFTPTLSTLCGVDVKLDGGAFPNADTDITANVHLGTIGGPVLVSATQSRCERRLSARRSLRLHAFGGDPWSDLRAGVGLPERDARVVLLIR